ncbi:NF-kappa-B inhibitor alpha-like isoform X3 [Oscarella lobularis]|uniref:NF-kappa-B inhibitor alpha-like isoform X3 n=1 Tax=Oscarella lobularis TaxID=121494 RepID=UPI003313FE6D
MANSERAFLSAVEEGDKETVSSYIRRYPEKWKTAKKGIGRETCLHLERDAEMARYLVSAGADMEARAISWNIPPFHSAAQYGNREVMEVLIESGCNIHAEGPHGEALAYASRKGHLGIVKRLIGLGLDVNHKSNKNGQTSLRWACWGNCAKIAEYLVSVGADFEAVNGNSVFGSPLRGK